MTATADSGPHLWATREQILAYRRRVNHLDERLPFTAESLRRIAWAGLQDSMPRAALLSIHARVEGAHPAVWEDPGYVQVWGPRYSAFVVAADDRAIFTLGRLPVADRGMKRAEDMADRLERLLGSDRMSYAQAGRMIGVPPNSLRYAATTGRVLMRWEGAGRPVVWVVPRPEIEPSAARLELARRYLHIFGPGTAKAFAGWAGITERTAIVAFEALNDALMPVRTPIGEAWILTSDEPLLLSAPGPVAPARLIPSGDAYFLLQGSQRELLVADEDNRKRLWTSRVWPGAVLVEGEIVGTWRRSNEVVTISTWRRPSSSQRDAVESEAVSLPIPGVQGAITIRWDD